MDFSLFDCIYVINLERSQDRRRHIIEEFRRVGIPDDKYIFFPAVDANETIVKEILKNKGRQILADGSSRIWKHLNKYQIGNWCSYLGVWTDILAHDYEFCLICEDDIKFTSYYKPVVDIVFNYEYLLHQGIDPDRPVVIGVGSGWQESVHRFSGNIGLVTEDPIGNRECNPCHIINRKMAKELLSNTTIIDTATDPYIHRKIGGRYQRYWVVPQPVYELSWNPQVKRFRSTIEGPIRSGECLR